MEMIVILPQLYNGICFCTYFATVAVGLVLIGVGFALNNYAENGNIDEARKSTVEDFITSLI